jgi:hypothetical protein
MPRKIRKEMRGPTENRPITARALGLRELPKAWTGSTLEQLIHSAEKVIEQSEAVGGSEDPRLRAARRILELRERSRAREKGAQFK